MKIFNKYLRVFTVLLTFLISSTVSYAQDDPPIGSDPCDYHDPFIPCPIDDGLAFLLAAGVGYGIIRYKQSKKASSLSGEN